MKKYFPTFPLNRTYQFILLSLVPLYFLFLGLCIDPFDMILKGLWAIIKEPDLLITDYIVIGGISATLINSSVLTLISILIIYCLNMDIEGHTITSCFLMLGFSLFGKNILNIWTILMGVWLASKHQRVPLSQYIYIGLYGTCLSPIITQILQIDSIPMEIKFILSILIGLVIGFVLPPLASHLHRVHNGFSLYNVGFAAGIISTVIASLFKSFGIEEKSRLIWSSGNNDLFGLMLTFFFFLLIVLGMFHDRHAFSNYRLLLSDDGVNGPDFVYKYGMHATFINMGINGLFSMIFVLLVGGDLNGPTIGGIFTIVGFSATGKHVLNIFPIMLGVYFASFLKTWNINDPSPMITLLFSTTLAPIAGRFGFLIGILAGFLHSSVALNIGILYNGMNLYNNGFAGGLVASFMIPLIQFFKDRKARVDDAL